MALDKDPELPGGMSTGRRGALCQGTVVCSRLPRICAWNQRREDHRGHVAGLSPLILIGPAIS